MTLRSLRSISIATTAVALLLSPRWASGHDKWLEVEPFVASPATATKLYLLTGDAFRQPELLPIRNGGRLIQFQLHTTAGRRNLLPTLREDQEPIAILPPGTLPIGTSVLVLDTAPIDIWIGAEKFAAYLLEERLVDILVQRVDRREEEAPGRERYTRSIKALVQVGNKFDGPALQPTSQALDIVPTANPYALALGSKLTVQVLFHGQPLPGRAVTIANRYQANVVTQVARTNQRGEVELSLSRAGDWMLSLVHMERSQEAGVDWRSYWASLTFAMAQTAP